MLKDLIRNLLSDLEMDESDLGHENNRFFLELEDNLLISFQEIDSESIAIQSEIGQIPEWDQEVLLTTVMTGNLFGEHTGGAVIALDENEEKLSLNLELPIQTTYNDFYGQIEAFLNFVEFWRTELQRHEEESEAKSDLLY